MLNAGVVAEAEFPTPNPLKQFCPSQLSHNLSA